MLKTKIGVNPAGETINHSPPVGKICIRDVIRENEGKVCTLKGGPICSKQIRVRNQSDEVDKIIKEQENI